MTMKITAVTDALSVEFEADAETSLLDAVLNAGWEVPYSCKRGGCENCRCTIVSGDVVPSPEADGSALLCMTRALGDVTIAPLRIAPRSTEAVKRIQAKVYRVTWAAPDVAVLQLRFPAGVRAKFRAGQYLNVLLPDEAPRSFSMANAPKQNDGVVLHVRIVPGGLFGGMLQAGLEAGSLLEVELPLGDFYLRDDDPSRPVLLVAGGTGFAPMQSLLEDALARHPNRQFVLYWGARDPQGLYALEAVRKWEKRFANFRFVGVVSDADVVVDPESGLRSGLVHKAVLADIPDLATYDVYVCGAPVMVQAVREEFAAQGMRGDRCFADSFMTQADLAQTA